MNVPFHRPPAGVSYTQHFTPTMRQLYAGAVPGIIRNAVVNKFIIQELLTRSLTANTAISGLPETTVAGIAGIATAVIKAIGAPGDVLETNLQKATTKEAKQAAKITFKNVFPHLTAGNSSAPAFFVAASKDAKQLYRGATAGALRDAVALPLFFMSSKYFEEGLGMDSLAAKLLAGQVNFF